MKAQLLLLTLLFSVGLAAEHLTDHEKYSTNQQQLSRRPYTVTPAVTPEKFEGDTVDSVDETKSEKDFKTLQMHNLGRRPHAEK